MPLEVNEIDIRMQVGNKADEDKKDKREIKSGCENPDYEDIVNECTHRVLKRLLAAKER